MTLHGKIPIFIEIDGASMCFLWPLQEAPLRSDSPGDSCGSCFQAFVRISRRIEGLSEGCWSGYRTQHWGKIGVVMTKNICDASKSNRTQSKIPKSFKYHFSHFTLFMLFYVSEFGTPSPWFFPYFAPFLMAMVERCHGRPQLGSKPPGPRRPGPVGPVGPALCHGGCGRCREVPLLQRHQHRQGGDG